MIGALANRSGRDRKEARPYSRVLILTGHELFGIYTPPRSWENACGVGDDPHGVHRADPQGIVGRWAS